MISFNVLGCNTVSQYADKNSTLVSKQRKITAYLCFPGVIWGIAVWGTDLRFRLKEVQIRPKWDTSGIFFKDLVPVIQNEQTTYLKMSIICPI